MRTNCHFQLISECQYAAHQRIINIFWLGDDWVCFPRGLPFQWNDLFEMPEMKICNDPDVKKSWIKRQPTANSCQMGFPHLLATKKHMAHNSSIVLWFYFPEASERECGIYSGANLQVHTPGKMTVQKLSPPPQRPTSPLHSRACVVKASFSFNLSSSNASALCIKASVFTGAVLRSYGDILKMISLNRRVFFK